MNGLSFLSVCSGIEAASVAWHPLGWQCVGVSEIEPFPCAVLEHHYPNVPNLGDLTEQGGWNVPSFDVLVGGTPCQGFSLAGKRGGMDDPRSQLVWHYAAIARKHRPKWLLWENVPGALSTNGGRDFGAVLGTLAELGYGFAYRVLDAQYYGVPQRRRRVFLVGYLGDWRRAAAVLFERESLQGDNPPSRQARENVTGSLAARTRGGGGLGTDMDIDGGLVAHADDVASTLTAGGSTKAPHGARTGKDNSLVAHTLKGEGFDASEDGTGRGTPIIPDTAYALQERDSKAPDSSTKEGHLIPHVFDPNQITSKTNRSNPTPELSHTLPGTPNAPIAFESRFARNGRGGPAEVVPPLKAQSGETGKGDAAPLMFQGAAVRRLTPTECARLQGFPDDYLDITYRNRPAADGPKYKALGNSMAVPVMRWIGERIGMVDAMTERADDAKG